MVATVAGSATDTGRVREHNEDSLLARHPVFAVADGMGGHAAGDVASALAVQALEQLAGRDDLTADDVAAAIRDANARIVRTGQERPETSGMGTTLAGVVLVSHEGAPKVLVFNVGDSRVYCLSGGELEQVSVDHSEVQELVDAGELSPEDARNYWRRNVVTRSLGMGRSVLPDAWAVDPQEGDRWMICSDGVSNELEDDRIAALLGPGGPQEAADRLVAAAVEAGGRDNATVVVVDIVG